MRGTAVETTASKVTTQIGVRVPDNFRERIDALKPHFGTTERAEVARKLMEHGLYAVVRGAELPPEPSMTDAEAAAVQKYLRRALRAHLDVLAVQAPQTALVAAYHVMKDVDAWTRDLAGRYGTTVEGLANALGEGQRESASADA
jgi:hypothetical protein